MKTGDTVKHGPSDETWTVAYVDGDHIAWCGWPPGEARLSDCTLVEECSQEESVALLRKLAEPRTDPWDRRSVMAWRRLRELGLGALEGAVGQAGGAGLAEDGFAGGGTVGEQVLEEGDRFGEGFGGFGAAGLQDVLGGVGQWPR